MLIYLVSESGSSLNNSFIANNMAAYRPYLRENTFWEIIAVSPMKEVDTPMEWRHVDVDI